MYDVCMKILNFGAGIDDSNIYVGRMRLKHSRLTHFQSNKLLEHFVAGTPARTAADLVDVNRNTARQFYHKLRQIIAWQIEEEWQFDGEIEVDESYFGGVRKGKRGRGAGGKVAVFGILKRGGKVYTKIIPDAKTDTLLPIIREKVVPDSIVYTDCWRGYNALDVSEFKHYRINHSELFADRHNHMLHVHLTFCCTSLSLSLQKLRLP